MRKKFAEREKGRRRLWIPHFLVHVQFAEYLRFFLNACVLLCVRAPCKRGFCGFACLHVNYLNARVSACMHTLVRACVRECVRLLAIEDKLNVENV